MMVYMYVCTCRLESEVSEVLGDRDYVTMEDLEKLQYTEQVLYYYYYVYHS
jgi:hypothetical protein